MQVRTKVFVAFDRRVDGRSRVGADDRPTRGPRAFGWTRSGTSRRRTIRDPEYPRKDYKNWDFGNPDLVGS